MAKPTRARHPHAILESQTHVDPRSILSPFRIHCKLHGWLCLTMREGMAASGELNLRSIDLWSAWECPVCIEHGITEATVTAFDDAWFSDYIDGHRFHRRDSAVQQGLQWGLEDAEPAFVYESIAPYLRGGDVPTALALRSGWVLGWILANLAKPRKAPEAVPSALHGPELDEWARGMIDEALVVQEQAQAQAPLRDWAEQWRNAGGFREPNSVRHDHQARRLSYSWRNPQRRLVMRVTLNQYPELRAYGQGGKEAQTAPGQQIDYETLVAYWRWFEGC